MEKVKCMYTYMQIFPFVKWGICTTQIPLKWPPDFITAEIINYRILWIKSCNDLMNWCFYPAQSLVYKRVNLKFNWIVLSSEAVCLLKKTPTNSKLFREVIMGKNLDVAMIDVAVQVLSWVTEITFKLAHFFYLHENLRKVTTASNH